MNVVLKIEALAAAPDSVVIAIGPDMVPTEFLKCGDSEWIAPCPSCPAGVIITDSPDYAAAMCDACEDKLDSEPVEARPRLEVRFPIPAPRPPSSLVSGTGKLPLPRLTITRPKYTPTPTPVCKKCGRYVTPDNSSGIIPKVCGVCREEGAAPAGPRPGCRDCDCDMSAYDKSKVFCNDCNRARAVTGQRRLTKASKTRRDNAAKGPKPVQKVCQRCNVDLGPVHHTTKYCPACKAETDRENKRAAMARSRARKITNEGETDGQ